MNNNINNNNVMGNPNPGARRGQNVPATNKRFAFTLNNPTQDEIDDIKNNDMFTYICFSHEVGETGTPHLQGYFVLGTSRRFSYIKRHVNARAHFEKAWASEQANYDYCKKDEGKYDTWSWYEQDNRVGQGRRTDLEAAIETYRTHGRQKVRDEHAVTFVRYHKGLDALFEPSVEPRTEKPTVIWIFGETGLGKTRYVMDRFGPTNIYIKDMEKWWDGYIGQQCVLFDDFRGGETFHKLLRMTDRYPMTVQVKNAVRQLNSPFIIFTSCHKPHEVYTNEKIQEDIGQFYRRIDMVHHYTGMGIYTECKAQCMAEANLPPPMAADDFNMPLAIDGAGAMEEQVQNDAADALINMEAWSMDDWINQFGN